MAGLVQLELDDKDKDNFKELQDSITEAQREIAGITQKMRTRNAEAKHAELTLEELSTIDDSTRTYEQVGKMFLMKPLTDLKAQLNETKESGQKEVASLTDQKKHREEVCACAQPSARRPPWPSCRPLGPRVARPSAPHCGQRPTVDRPHGRLTLPSCVRTATGRRSQS